MWIIENSELKNTENTVWIEKIFTEPYPRSLWRIDPLKNGGMPFNELIPDIAVINIFSEPTTQYVHVYGSRNNDYDSNGYAILMPTECTVETEKNGLYELEMIHPCDEKFAYIKNNCVLKCPIKYHDSIIYQLFRIYSTEKSMDSSGMMQIRIYARHIFYDLNDVLLIDCRPTQLQGQAALEWIINGAYYTTVAEDFNIYSNIINNRTAYYEKMSITSALIGADNSFVSRWGGTLYRDNYYFSICNPIENQRTAGVIRYGLNMTEIEFSEDYSEVCTVLVAYDNFGNRHRLVDNTVPNDNIPHHICKVVDFSYDTENVEQFKSDAQAYFDLYKSPAINIKVKLIDLIDLDLYADFLQLNNYEVGDKVYIRNIDLGIDYINLEIISKTYDVANQRTTEIKIGSFRPAYGRDRFMSGTATTLSSPLDKQAAALQSELKNVKLKTFMNWGLASASTWAEASEYTWKEVFDIVN